MHGQERLFVVRNPKVRDFQAESRRVPNNNLNVLSNNDLINFDNEVSVTNGINVFLNFVVGMCQKLLIIMSKHAQHKGKCRFGFLFIKTNIYELFWLR